MSNPHGLVPGDTIRLPPEALGLPTPDGAPRVEYTVVSVDVNGFKLSAGHGPRTGGAVPRQQPPVPRWARRRGRR